MRQMQAPMSPGLRRGPVGRPRGAGGVFPPPRLAAGAAPPPIRAAGGPPPVFPMPGRRMPPPPVSMTPETDAEIEKLAPAAPGPGPDPTLAPPAPGPASDFATIDRRPAPFDGDKPVFNASAPPWMDTPPMPMADEPPLPGKLPPMRKMSVEPEEDKFEFGY